MPPPPPHAAVSRGGEPEGASAASLSRAVRAAMSTAARGPCRAQLSLLPVTEVVVLEIDALIPELGFEVVIDLRAGTTGAGGAGGPEVVSLVHADNPLRVHTHHIAPDVLGFVGGTLNQSWSAYQWQRVDINGARGALVFDGPNVVASISLVWDGQGCLSGIYIIRNPDKLARLGDADRTVQ